ncbi:Ankyrin 2,3 [Echinococcus multilocularis]|uniref:Ankyrin 2,3 n=1 Tax=Echinococcus multilocularis TaxID=6211 RepID=A0A0S4MM72_ECHMU|nr:Ankyrin 2,3 [Echinococcus multilocularis]
MWVSRLHTKFKCKWHVGNSGLLLHPVQEFLANSPPIWLSSVHHRYIFCIIWNHSGIWLGYENWVSQTRDAVNERTVISKVVTFVNTRWVARLIADLPANRADQGAKRGTSHVCELVDG